MEVGALCDAIFTEEGEINTPAGMDERGWIVTEEDIDRAYTSLPLEQLKQERGSCLCPIKVEQVLDRHEVQWEHDVWGYAIAPLKGESWPT